MIIILIYLLLILLALILIYTRTGTTLFHIKTFFWINVIFLVTSIASLIIYSTYIPIILFTLLVLISLFLHKVCFLLNYNSQDTQAIIEDSLSLVLTPFTKTNDKYHITLGNNQASIRIIRILPQTALLTFGGNWWLNKGRIIQSLFKKKFRSALPRLIIKLKDNGENN